MMALCLLVVISPASAVAYDFMSYHAQTDNMDRYDTALEAHHSRRNRNLVQTVVHEAARWTAASGKRRIQNSTTSPLGFDDGYGCV